MHDLEVTDVDPVVRAGRRRRAKRAFDPTTFRSLFRMFRWLRGASVEALHELWFKGAFPGQSTRTTGRMVRALIDEGFLARMRLPHARMICHLTRSSLATFDAAGIAVPETLRRPPTVEIGGYLWLLSNIRAEHVRGGFTVGRGPRDAYALRRFLLDSAKETKRHVLDAIRANPALTPMVVAGCDCGFRADFGANVSACPKCRHATRWLPASAKYECAGCKAVADKPGAHRGCSLAMREVDALPVDVAWTKLGGQYDVRLLFVEQPTRTLGAQLAELPLMHVGAPKVPVLLRSTDPDSRYDRKRHEWAVKGPRQQQLERTFMERSFDASLPFSETATVVNALADLQAHILRCGAPAPGWDCAPAWNGGAARNRRQHERDAERPREIERDNELVRNVDIAARRIAEREVVAPVREVRAEPVVRERVSGVRERASGGGMRRR